MRLLLILSDINGLFLPEQNTPARLEKQFDRIDKVNTISLAGVAEHAEKDERHLALISGGIDAAAEKLIELYPGRIQVALGLSVGGVVLWRAAEKGLKIDRLVCFSSTRLRFETSSPKCNTTLYFGSQDEFRPVQAWFERMNLTQNIIADAEHEFYRTSLGNQVFKDELGKL